MLILYFTLVIMTVCLTFGVAVFIAERGRSRTQAPAPSQPPPSLQPPPSSQPSQAYSQPPPLSLQPSQAWSQQPPPSLQPSQAWSQQPPPSSQPSQAWSQQQQQQPSDASDVGDGTAPDTWQLTAVNTGTARRNLERSDALKQRLRSACVANQRPYVPSQWDRNGTQGYYGPNPYERESTGRTPYGVPLYGGTCLWCSPGTGEWLPQTAPLPFGGPRAAGTTGDSRIDAPTFDLKKLMRPLRVNLPNGRPARTDIDDLRSSGDPATDILPLAVQPNGGLQLAYAEAATGYLRVLYMDPDGHVLRSFRLQGESVGGLVAFDDGTAMLMSQRECDAAASSNPGMVQKAVVVLYRGGRLVWARAVTNTFASVAMPRTDADGNPLGVDETEDPDGGGEFVGNLNGAQLEYDSETGVLGAYFKNTSGAGHTGSVLKLVRLSDGQVLSSLGGCSHEISSRVIGNRDFPFLCICDCEYGLTRPVQLRSQQRGPGQLIASVSAENYLGFDQGFASVNFGTFLRRQDTTLPFLAAVASKRGKKYMGIFFLLMDRDLVAQQRIAYSDNDQSNVEFSHVHLAPYGMDTSRETYLLSYGIKDMSKITCGSYDRRGLEERCEAPLARFVMRIVEVVGGCIKNVTAATETTDTTLFMQSCRDPVRDPGTGDLLWASFGPRTSTAAGAVAPTVSIVRMRAARIAVPPLPGCYETTAVPTRVVYDPKDLPPAPTSQMLQSPKLVLAIGDLVSAGMYVDFDAGEYKTYPYTAKLQGLLGARAHVHNVPCGRMLVFSGAPFMKRALAQITSLGRKYDWILVYGGLYDSSFPSDNIWNGVNAGQPDEGRLAMYDAALAHGARLVVMTVPHNKLTRIMYDSWKVNLAEMNHRIRQFAAAKAPRVLLVDLDRKPDMEGLFTSMGVFLPPAGADRMGQYVYDVIGSQV